MSIYCMVSAGAGILWWRRVMLRRTLFSRLPLSQGRRYMHVCAKNQVWKTFALTD